MTKEMIKTKSVFKNKQFQRICGAQLVSDAGNWVYTIAISAIIYAYTRSAFALSLMLLISLVPAAIFSIVGGGISDRTNPKKMMIITDLIRGIATLAAISVLYTNSILILYIIAFTNSICGALFTTSKYKIITSIIEDDQLTSAFSKLRILYELTVICGSAIGGILYSFLGFELVIGINSATFFISLLFIIMIKYKYEPSVAEEQSSYLKTQKEAFVEIASNYKLKKLVIYKFFYTVSGGILNVLPSILALQVYKFGDMGIGFMYSGIGVGSIIGAYLVGVQKETIYKSKTLLISGGVTVLGWFLLMNSTTFYFAIASVLIVCVGNIFSHTYIESYSLKVIDSSMVGRISGVFQSLTYVALGVSLTVLAKVLDYNTNTALAVCIVLLVIPNIYVVYLTISNNKVEKLEKSEENA